MERNAPIERLRLH